MSFAMESRTRVALPFALQATRDACRRKEKEFLFLWGRPSHCIESDTYIREACNFNNNATSVESARTIKQTIKDNNNGV